MYELYDGEGSLCSVTAVKDFWDETRNCQRMHSQQESIYQKAETSHDQEHPLTFSPTRKNACCTVRDDPTDAAS